MRAIVDKRGSNLKSDILAEFRFESSAKEMDRGMLVEHGVVTLKGHTSHPGKNCHAVRALKRMALDPGVIVELKRVLLEASDSHLLLAGMVRNYLEQDETKFTAWAASRDPTTACWWFRPGLWGRDACHEKR